MDTSQLHLLEKRISRLERQSRQWKTITTLALALAVAGLLHGVWPARVVEAQVPSIFAAEHLLAGDIHISPAASGVTGGGVADVMATDNDSRVTLLGPDTAGDAMIAMQVDAQGPHIAMYDSSHNLVWSAP